jgi:very-short-patch-repair endonuclease
MSIPRDDASELEWLLFAQSGVLTSAQAVSLGLGQRARHLVGAGRWRRICRGVLVTYAGPLTVDQQHWVAVLAAGEGALLAGLASARSGGLRGRWRYELVDVLVPYDRRARDLWDRLPLGMPAVRVRRTRQLVAGDRQRDRPDRTTMARSVVDAMQWVPGDREAQSILAAACQQGRVTVAEVREVLDRLPNVRRHRLIVETLADVEGGAEALSEIDLLRLCRRYRLPAPELQSRRVDASGRVRYVDALWRRWGLQVEVDGAHHRDAGQWAADMRRQNDVWIAGERILRFAAFDLRRRPAEVAAQIRAALCAAGCEQLSRP